MPRFFVSSSAIEISGGRERIRVTGEDAAHITRALRMRPGEHITVCDDAGIEYETVIFDVGEEVGVEVLSKKASENEPPYRATVYQALVKGDRFDTVLMKSTELGACRIVPVASARCTVKLDGREGAKKRERWQRIAAEAAKQCGRAYIPEVTEPVRFEDAILLAARADLPLFCYEGGGCEPLSRITGAVKAPGTVSVVIGPEGGFEPSEAEAAGRAGLRMTGLGRRILRTETAAPFVLSCLSFRYELERDPAIE